MTDPRIASEKELAIAYLSAVETLAPYAKFLQGDLTIDELKQIPAEKQYNDYGVRSAKTAIEQVKATRRAARAEADASIALEGFQCSEAAKAIFNRFDNCEISSEQVLLEVLKLPEG